jgi:predicted nucleic acid-binding protein
MILVDTTVLAYAVGDDHPLRAPCRRLLDAHGDATIDIATTVDVLQEFTHIRARRRSREDAAELTRLYAEALTVLETSPDDLGRGLDIFLKHKQIGAFDAVLAGVAIRYDVQALVSADRAFGEIDGLRHVDPATPRLGRLLRPKG